MPGKLDRREREEIREAIDLRLAAIAEDLDELETEGGLAPDECERLTLEATAICRDAAAPTEVGPLVIEAIERLGGSAASLLFHATAMLVPELIVPVRAARRRLPAGERSDRLPVGTGDLRLVEARRYVKHDEDLYLMLLARPRAGGPDPEVRWQVACIPVGRERGAIFDGFLTPARDEATARELLAVPEEGGDAGAPDPVPADELEQALRRAAERNRAHGLPVRWELGLALPLLGRALCEDAATLTGVAIMPEGGELWADPEDEESFQGLREAVLGDYQQWLDEVGESGDAARSAAPGPREIEALHRSGSFIAGAMLDRKWGIDGRMGHWTEEDVEDFLFGYAPRKLPSDEETIADTPACVASFLDFLSGIRMLSGDPVGDLIERCEELRGEFAAAMRDGDRWGPAKSLAAQMGAEGVDIESRDEVDAWIADFNARPRAVRDEVFGEAVDRSIAVGLTGDPEAPPPWEIGAALGPRRDRSVLAITWFPPQEYSRALEHWEELGERWHGVDHAEYARRMEATFRGWQKAGHRPWLAPVRLDEYLAWCEAGGHDPAEARPTYAVEMLEAGDAAVWPPARNDPCWCGSGAKYKRCCGTVEEAVLDPFAAMP